MTNENKNEKIIEKNDIETTVEVEEIETEDIVVDESKPKKFFESLKAGAKKNKKKIIGAGLAAAGIAVAVYKIATSKDDVVCDDDDYGIVDVESVEIEPEVNEVVE